MKEIKHISMVYQDWNGDEPIGNGYGFVDKSKMPSDRVQPHFFISHGYVETHLNDDYHRDDLNNKKFEVTLKKINEVTDDHLHIFGISHISLRYEDFASEWISFPREVVNLTQQNKNFYLLFLLEHESDDEKSTLKFYDKLKKEGFNLSKIILVNNNSRVYDYKEKNNLECIVHKSKFLEFSAGKVFSNTNSNYVTEKNGKFFISRNRCGRSHRKLFVFDIIKNNLENDINYSFLNQHGHGGYEWYEEFFNKMPEGTDKELVDKVNSLYKECDYEVGLNYIDPSSKEFIHDNSDNHLFLIPEHNPAFENSYFNIVTETCFTEENLIHATEKSFRPFNFYMFPIFFATKGHVQYLRDEFNFDLFDDVIDHSYDNEENFVKRYNMVWSEIKRINDDKEFFIKFYNENKFRFSLNKQKLYTKGRLGQLKDIDLIWNL